MRNAWMFAAIAGLLLFWPLESAILAQAPTSAPAASQATRRSATFLGIPWGTPKEESRAKLRASGYATPVLDDAKAGLAFMEQLYGREAVVAIGFKEDQLYEIHILWNLSKGSPEDAESFRGRLLKQTTERYGAPSKSSPPEAAAREYVWVAERLQLRFLSSIVSLDYWGLNAAEFEASQKPVKANTEIASKLLGLTPEQVEARLGKPWVVEGRRWSYATGSLLVYFNTENVVWDVQPPTFDLRTLQKK